MVLDEYSRECLAIYVDRKINSQSVKRALAEVIEEPGAPTYARSDNGPEFVSKNLRLWLSKQDIRPQYIEPGSPWQNGFIESFNDTFRRECLNREQLWSRGGKRNQSATGGGSSITTSGHTVQLTTKHRWNSLRELTSLRYVSPLN